MIEDTDGAVVAARAAGVAPLVTIGIDIETSRQAIQLAERFPEVFATVGLHPHDAAGWGADACAQLESLAKHPKVVAIGECGLDYYRDVSPRDAQREAFRGQMNLARRMGLPLVVHVRDAGAEALALLADEASDLTVVMHCFSLTDRVEECNERGYYASFAGNVTYKNAADLRAAAARVRDDLLLVETDAPFLTPAPHRGKENTPAMVRLVAETLAQSRQCPMERIAELTTANAHRVFGLQV